MAETADLSRIMNGVLPYVAIARTDEAIAFYEKAFGAIVHGDVARDDKGRVMNATVEINGGAIMFSGEFEEMGEPAARGGQGFTLQLIVTDGDFWWKRAVDAGCEITAPFALQFWGDRYGRVRDPFGLDWAFNEPAASKR